MSKLLSVKIDVTKIDKSRLFQGKKGTYLDADIWINDEQDKFGNDASVSMSQTKEEREAKAQKIYIGSARKVFGWDDAPVSKAAPASEQEDDEEDSLPF